MGDAGSRRNYVAALVVNDLEMMSWCMILMRLFVLMLS